MKLFESATAIHEFRTKYFKEALDRTTLAWEKEDALTKTTNHQRSLLTISEERQLISYYLSKIRDYCRFFKFDKHVEASSIVLFQRFYLSSSLLEYDAKAILVCCIFLSTKIEHRTVPLAEFLAKIPKSPSKSEMVELELLVSTVLKFDYMVRNPYWPLHGFFLDMQVFIQSQQIPPSEKQSILQNLLSSYNQSFQIVPKALQTDLIFLYPPSQIALACLWACQTPDIQLKDYIESRLCQSQEQETGAKLIQLITKLAHEIVSSSTIEKELAKILASKADSGFSPVFNQTSLLYKQLLKKRKDALSEDEEDGGGAVDPFQERLLK